MISWARILIESDQWSRRLCVIAVVLIVFDVTHRLGCISLGVPALEKDALGYWRMGELVASGDLLLIGEPEGFRVPGYAYFLGASHVFGSSALLAIVIAQHAVGVLTGFMTAVLVGRVTASPRAFVWALACGVLCVNRVWFGNYVLSETLFTLLLLLHAWALIEGQHRARLRWTVAAGALLACAVLTRPVAQLLLSVDLLVIGLLGEGRPGRRVRHIALFLMAFGLIVGAWTLRNAAKFGQPFISRALGRNLWLSCFESDCGNLEFPRGQSGEVITQRLVGFPAARANWRHTWSVYNALRKSGMEELEAERIMTSASLDAIRAAPVQFVRSVVVRCARYWYVTGSASRPAWKEQGRYLGQSQWNWPGLSNAYRAALGTLHFPHAAVTLLSSLIAFLGAGASVMSSCRVFRRVGMLVAGTLIYTCAVTCVVEKPGYRYRMIIEPFMIIGAVTGAVALSRRMTRLSAESGPAVSSPAC